MKFVLCGRHSLLFLKSGGIMSGMRIVLVLLLSVAIAATTGCWSGDSAEVAALAERVDTLEKQIQTLNSSGGSKEGKRVVRY